MGLQPHYLCHSQDGHGEHKRDGPGDEVEVGGLAQQRLVGGAQRLEGRVPGVGQHDKPDDARHQRVVDDDKDDDAGERLVGAIGSKTGVPLATGRGQGGPPALQVKHPHVPRALPFPRARRTLLASGDTSCFEAPRTLPVPGNTSCPGALRTLLQTPLVPLVEKPS